MKPFDTYSLAHAIRDGNVLDTLQNYSSVATYARIRPVDEIEEQGPWHAQSATAHVLHFASCHLEILRAKARFIVRHFADIMRSRTTPLFQPKSMVVCSSRRHAILMKQQIEQQIELLLPDEQRFDVVVAFAAFVLDGRRMTELDANKPEYCNVERAFRSLANRVRMMVVADKFLTGFDEPMLHTMYIDRMLAGNRAVQTISRLNRTAVDKRDTCVVDFVNVRKAIGEAFAMFWHKTTLKKRSVATVERELRLASVIHQLLTIQPIRDQVPPADCVPLLLTDVAALKRDMMTVIERDLTSVIETCDQLQMEHPELPYAYACRLRAALQEWLASHRDSELERIDDNIVVTVEDLVPTAEGPVPLAAYKPLGQRLVPLRVHNYLARDEAATTTTTTAGAELPLSTAQVIDRADQKFRTHQGNLHIEAKRDSDNDEEPEEILERARRAFEPVAPRIDAHAEPRDSSTTTTTTTTATATSTSIETPSVPVQAAGATVQLQVAASRIVAGSNLCNELDEWFTQQIEPTPHEPQPTIKQEPSTVKQAPPTVKQAPPTVKQEQLPVAEAVDTGTSDTEPPLACSVAVEAFEDDDDEPEPEWSIAESERPTMQAIVTQAESSRSAKLRIKALQAMRGHAAVERLGSALVRLHALPVLVEMATSAKTVPERELACQVLVALLNSTHAYAVHAVARLGGIELFTRLLHLPAPYDTPQLRALAAKALAAMAGKHANRRVRAHLRSCNTAARLLELLSLTTSDTTATGSATATTTTPDSAAIRGFIPDQDLTRHIASALEALAHEPELAEQLTTLGGVEQLLEVLSSTSVSDTIERVACALLMVCQTSSEALEHLEQSSAFHPLTKRLARSANEVIAATWHSLLELLAAKRRRTLEADRTHYHRSSHRRERSPSRERYTSASSSSSSRHRSRSRQASPSPPPSRYSHSRRSEYRERRASPQRAHRDADYRQSAEPSPRSHQTSTYTPQDTSTYTPHQTSTYTLQDTSTYTPHQTLTYTPHQTSTYTPHQTSTYTPYQTSTYTPHQTSTYTPQDTSTYTPHQTSTYTPQDTSTYTPHQTLTYTSHQTSTYTPRDTSTYTPHQTSTYTPQDTYTPYQTSTYTPHHSSTHMPQPTPTYSTTMHQQAPYSQPPPGAGYWPNWHPAPYGYYEYAAPSATASSTPAPAAPPFYAQDQRRA